jgi:hypothetical protein
VTCSARVQHRSQARAVLSAQGLRRRQWYVRGVRRHDEHGASVGRTLLSDPFDLGFERGCREWIPLISNQRLRLSSKHPPMKESTQTTTAVTIPAQKTGLS